VLHKGFYKFYVDVPNCNELNAVCVVVPLEKATQLANSQKTVCAIFLNIFVYYSILDKKRIDDKISRNAIYI
jgi:hypothetical protein